MQRILVIEDENDIRQLLRFNLEREGFAVLEAADGLGGLHMATSELPDLVVLDLMLPGMDGFDIFYGGFRGVTIRAVVLLPYLIACLMERKYFGVILCVLAEACMVWTLYGAGVCLLVTLGWVVLHKLLSLLPGRRKKEAAG